MNRTFALPALTIGATVAALTVGVAPASAHGYISSPPSRQANCAAGTVTGCGDTQLASFDDGGAQPGATVSHTVDMRGFTGAQTVLARWNVADTAMAFYACVDVTIGA